MTNEKHPHAELIHAWADGAEIEVYYSVDGREGWASCRSPDWKPSGKYRLKPKMTTLFYRTDIYFFPNGDLLPYTLSGKTESEINREFEYSCKFAKHIHVITPTQKIELLDVDEKE